MPILVDHIVFQICMKFSSQNVFTTFFFSSINILTFSLNFFFFFFFGWVALSPLAKIGSHGVRNFMLCKKQRQLQLTDRKPSDLIAQKGMSYWKAWLNNPFTFKLMSH